MQLLFGPMTTTPIRQRNVMTNVHLSRRSGFGRRCGLFVLALLTLLGWTGSNQAFAACGDNNLSLTERRELKFGSVAGSSEGSGTVTISADGIKSTTGFVLDFGKTHRSARFRLTGGGRNCTVEITLPSSMTVTNGSGGTATVNNFTANTPLTVVLGRRGRLTFDVGATMAVPAGLPGGDYTGTFIVTIDELPDP